MIKVLDEHLLKLNMSPSLLFKQADINNNKKVDIMELKEILFQISQQSPTQIDDMTLREIITELDVNGNGQLEEQEFYNLIRNSRSNINKQD